MDDGSSGYLVKYGDTDALAACLEKLITDPGLRLRMGEEGRAIAEQHSWSRLAERMEEIYLELV